MPGLGFLTSRIAGPVASAAALVLLVALAVQTFRLADMKDQRDDYRAALLTAQGNLAQSRTNVATLRFDLDAQNAAVAALEARTAALAQARLDALAEAESARATARDRLASARSVPPAETQCKTVGLRMTQFLFGGR